jgi:hypothetical protein
MKKITFLMALMLCSVLPSFAQADTSAANIDVEWIAVDESQLDSTTKQYFLKERLATFANPKIEDSGIITVVVNYLADIFDQILTSLTEKTEKFYGTSLGKITIWSLAYGYAGQELVSYLMAVLVTIGLLVAFTIIARKYMVFRTKPIEYAKAGDDPNTDEIEYEFKGIQVFRNYVITIVFIALVLIVNSCSI